MNIPDGFFENPVSPEYADLLSTMGAPIHFTEHRIDLLFQKCPQHRRILRANG